jgi:hypothetical protein
LALKGIAESSNDDFDERLLIFRLAGRCGGISGSNPMIPPRSLTTLPIIAALSSRFILFGV